MWCRPNTELQCNNNEEQKKQYLLQVVEKQKHDLTTCNRDNLQDIQNTTMKIVINLGLGVAGTTF